MRCLIVDDHPLTRDGTAAALTAVQSTIEIFEASSLEGAIVLLDREGDVDLVLLDLQLEDSDGIQTLESLKAWLDGRDFNARVVVVSGLCEPSLVRAVVDRFATGFIVKATSQNIFKQAVALTIAGGVYIPDVALREMAPSTARSGSERQLAKKEFTQRESEVASLLVRGYTYKKIARELERQDGKPISEHTVRAHVGNIAWKLGVTENAKAGVMAEIARRQLVFPG